jgi:hypothetical protein
MHWNEKEKGKLLWVRLPLRPFAAVSLLTYCRVLQRGRNTGGYYTNSVGPGFPCKAPAHSSALTLRLAHCSLRRRLRGGRRIARASLG